MRLKTLSVECGVICLSLRSHFEFHLELMSRLFRLQSSLCYQIVNAYRQFHPYGTLALGSIDLEATSGLEGSEALFWIVKIANDTIKEI